MENINIDSLWFYLEPYTFISEDTDYYFFYNSNIFTGLSFHKNEAIDYIVKKLQNSENLYSIKINIKDLGNQYLFDFIESIQASECGDIIEGNLEKPLIMPPILNLQQSVKRLKEHNVSLTENILAYLHEVAIYVNGECTLHCPNCSNGFKQHLCCTQSANILNPILLKNFLFSISHSGATITILGGNIFQYTELKELISLLEKMDTTYTLVSDWRNIPLDSEILNILCKESLKLKILVNDLYDIPPLVTLAKKIKQNHINQCWEIHITSISEYKKAETLNKQLSDLADVRIRPFYNGKNRSFFEECIFIDQEELDTIKLDRQGIFALQALNTHNFGKITVLPDGKVYANVNENAIGFITDSIKEIVGKEFEKGTSWRRTRYNIEPCNKCRFKLICPSPSNYELVIKKNNLCHIKT